MALQRATSACRPPPTSPVTATLLVSCRDRTGLVAALSEFVFENGGNILDADQHAEVETGLFFMRLVWDLDGFKLARDADRRRRSRRWRRGSISAWELTYSDVRPRVAVFASQAPHCLYDLLLAHQLGELGGDLAVVVSNHDDLRPVAGHFGVRFEHVPVDAGDKAARRGDRAAAARRAADRSGRARALHADPVARRSSARWPARIINIHHSFLPAFVGAKPYHQAKARGVKVIGATAHYVTSELDQGPIIEQDVCRVSHRDDVDELVRKGGELERRVLTRAVRLHLERRVLVSGNRTIVFG